LYVRWKRVVLLDKIRELVDDDDKILSLELFPEVFERLVPTVDSRGALIEVVRNLVEELLALSVLGFLRGKEVNMGIISTEFFEEFCFPDSTPAIDDNEVRTGNPAAAVSVSSSPSRS
jgi:hypothetical protein